MIKDQNVATHSFGVASLAYQVCEEKCLSVEEKYKVLSEALFHDLHEGELGDIGYDIKRRIPEGIQKMESEVEEKAGLSGYGASDLVKLCDMVELVQTLADEMMFGNRNIEILEMMMYGSIYSWNLANKVRSKYILGLLDQIANKMFSYYNPENAMVELIGSTFNDLSGIHCEGIRTRLDTAVQDNAVQYVGSKLLLTHYDSKYSEFVGNVESNSSIRNGIIISEPVMNNNEFLKCGLFLVSWNSDRTFSKVEINE